jgi:tetratricopeptide (TPR) repeat protein
MSARRHAIDAYFQGGVRLHGAGRLQEAEQVYRQVLAEQPRHADASHMLGVIATQCGQPQAALACIDQAIALKPSAAIFHVNRAAALLALRRLDDALAACQAGLRLQRNLAQASQVMGHVLSDLGRPEEALAAYRDALRHGPDVPDLYNNIGLALRQAGRLEEALVALRQAVRRTPRDAQAQGNLAGVLKDRPRPRRAIAPRCAAIRTIRCCTSTWESSSCFPAGSPMAGRNTNGGSAPAPPMCRRAARRAGTARTSPGARC